MHLDQATGGVALMAVAVYPPPSLCMECATARCVGGSMPTRTTHQMPSLHTTTIELSQLTVSMSME